MRLKAAIYIEGHRSIDGSLQGRAHVETINVMQGANIRGDIISHWNSRSSRDDPTFETLLHDKGTTLTFGLRPDADGSATTSPDADFRFVFFGR